MNRTRLPLYRVKTRITTQDPQLVKSLIDTLENLFKKLNCGIGRISSTSMLCVCEENVLVKIYLEEFTEISYTQRLAIPRITIAITVESSSPRDLYEIFSLLIENVRSLGVKIELVE